MPQTLLTFGDSNTHGTLPITNLEHSNRLAPHQRWPGVVQARLGGTLIEEGLPGRTCASPDPDRGVFMDGRLGLPIALQSHGPIDLLTLMLGTNDVKARFALSPEEIARHMAGLLDYALSPDIQARHGSFDILLICPPPVIETGVLGADFAGGATRSRALPLLYADLAAARRIGFLDAGRLISCSPIDGVHFGATEHEILGAAVADILAEPGNTPV